MTSRFQDLLIGNGAVVVFAVMAWAWGRTVRLGRPLTVVQKGMLLYASVFMLGLANTMMIFSWFDWSHPKMWAIISSWGVLLASVAWFQHHRGTRTTVKKNSD